MEVRSVRLLKAAISKQPETVLDIATGPGMHAVSFIATGSKVTGVDVSPPEVIHKNYEHIASPYEKLDLDDRQFDMVFSCHTLEHIPNVQHFLVALRGWLKDDGWLAISVPPSLQNRLHIGHLTLWTPAHLIYNLICAGWDCKLAKWYTEYCTIGLMVRKTKDIDLAGRTALPSESVWLQEYAPRTMGHNCGAWFGNNWPDETTPRVPDPPSVTVGLKNTDLPPEIQLAYGPNPQLRVGYERPLEQD